MKRLLMFVGLATLCSGTLTVAQQPASGHVLVSPPAIKWGPSPPGLPPGAEAAVLAGDPAVAGELFTLRLKMPAGYKVPPHWHPGDESVTVVSGQLMVGMGETFDAAKMHALGQGRLRRCQRKCGTTRRRRARPSSRCTASAPSESPTSTPRTIRGGRRTERLKCRKSEVLKCESAEVLGC